MFRTTTGGDFNLLLQEYDWYELSRYQNVPVGSIRLNLGSLSEFAIHCIAGHYKIKRITFLTFDILIIFGMCILCIISYHIIS